MSVWPIDKRTSGRVRLRGDSKHGYGGFVTVRVPVTKKQLRAYAGSKCRSYERGCGCCDAWRSWEQNDGTVSLLLVYEELMQLINR